MFWPPCELVPSRKPTAPSPTSALVLSQVVLSFGIPFALIPLVHLTSRHDLMGTHVNKRLTTWTAVAIATLISLLNVFLLYQYFS
jgi:manganese transport protein